MKLNKDKEYDKRRSVMINKYKDKAREIDTKYQILGDKYKRRLDCSVALNSELNNMWKLARQEFDIYNTGHVILIDSKIYIIREIKGDEFNSDTFMLIDKYGMMPIYIAKMFEDIISYLDTKYKRIKKDEYIKE